MFGPDGQLGIIFEDNSDGAGHVYMLRLECAAALLD
jgi:hypothetical protein